MTIFVCDLRWVYANLVEVSIVGISYAKFCDWCWLSVINLSLTPLHLMLYRWTMIHINIYYDGPLSNANPYDGFPFQGPGIQRYYMMIRCKLKILNDLKVKIMEELQVNLALHDIHITFRSPHEVLNQCINYRHIAITENKHVKFMFSKMQKWEKVADFELYVTSESRVEVGIKEIVQTNTTL